MVLNFNGLEITWRAVFLATHGIIVIICAAAVQQKTHLGLSEKITKIGIEIGNSFIVSKIQIIYHDFKHDFTDKKSEVTALINLMNVCL